MLKKNTQKDLKKPKEFCNIVGDTMDSCAGAVDFRTGLSMNSAEKRGKHV